MYLCDNGMQLTQAIEDFEYTKWLDPDADYATIIECEAEDLAGLI